jgi:hypothetical protein
MRWLQLVDSAMVAANRLQLMMNELTMMMTMTMMNRVLVIRLNEPHDECGGDECTVTKFSCDDDVDDDDDDDDDDDFDGDEPIEKTFFFFFFFFGFTNTDTVEQFVFFQRKGELFDFCVACIFQ